jgi:hypothetical protein
VLYEISIVAVRLVEKRRAREDAARETEDEGGSGNAAEEGSDVKPAE